MSFPGVSWPELKGSTRLASGTVTRTTAGSTPTPRLVASLTLRACRGLEPRCNYYSWALSRVALLQIWNPRAQRMRTSSPSNNTNSWPRRCCQASLGHGPSSHTVPLACRPVFPASRPPRKPMGHDEYRLIRIESDDSAPCTYNNKNARTHETFYIPPHIRN